MKKTKEFEIDFRYIIEETELVEAESIEEAKEKFFNGEGSAAYNTTQIVDSEKMITGIRIVD